MVDIYWAQDFVSTVWYLKVLDLRDLAEYADLSSEVSDGLGKLVLNINTHFNI